MSRKLKNFWRDDGFLKKERGWFKKREWDPSTYYTCEVNHVSYYRYKSKNEAGLQNNENIQFYISSMFWSIQCLDKLLEKWYTKFSLIEGDWRLSLILPNMIFSNLGSFRYFYATICSTPTFLLTVPVTNDAFENVVTLLFTLKMQHQTGGCTLFYHAKELNNSVGQDIQEWTK